MDELTRKLQKTRDLDVSFAPEFYYLKDDSSRIIFNELLKNDSVKVYDEIYGQLKELIKSRNPRTPLADNDFSSMINAHLKGTAIEEYGVWTYYPWSGRLVHMLDKEEYIELRTSANRHKITIEERDILAQKKVGVIGLSVGQSVSVTMAMERGCGELRLADFDTLELNNLNRIRTGVHNLGLLKVYSVAREIAEIDPFFKVVCYPKGINEENIDDFFLKDGKLDAVIDECDSVNVKIFCRIKAKELQVPVLMEASDRGTLDVERFDLDPSRPIMHGWLKHLQIDLKFLNSLKTAQEKLPYILPISGLETLSTRMRASMIEMQSTITTWPQLATAVTLGGAITADTARRIFLGQFKDSGRYFIDMENLVRDPKPRQEYVPADEGTLLSENNLYNISMMAFKKLPASTFVPDQNKVKLLVAAAIKAPSSGNSQPWKWYFIKNTLFLFAETEEASPFSDSKGFSAQMACGAALENFELMAASLKVGIQIHTAPLADQKKLVAAIQFSELDKNAEKGNPALKLVKFIDYRHTNRMQGTMERLPIDTLRELRKMVESIPEAQLTILDQRAQIEQMAVIAGVCDRIKLIHQPSHFEFFREIRWSNEECARSGDGLHVDSLGLSPMEVIMLKMIKRPDVVRFLSESRLGSALEFSSRANILSSSAIGLITVPDISPINLILAGKAIQRMWLAATKLEVIIHPIQTPILQFQHLINRTTKGMPGYLQDQLTHCHYEFKQLFGEPGDRKAVFLFRCSKAEEPAIRTFRKQLEKVLYFTE